MGRAQKNYQFNDNCYNDIKIFIANDLKNRIEKFMELYEYNQIMVICIGSSKFNYDCYGPMIGTKLLPLENIPNIKVYGTMKTPLNGTNIESFVYKYNKEMYESLVIAIDCTISENDSIGSIIISNDGIYPGAATGKILPHIGDFSIRGVVANNNIYDILNDFFNSLSLNKQKFIDIINIEDLIKMANMTIDAMTIALESIFETKRENTQDYKKLTK